MQLWRDRILTASLAAVLWLGTPALAGATGRLTGRIQRVDGSGAPGVVVVVNEIGTAAISDRSGAFARAAAPRGRCKPPGGG